MGWNRPCENGRANASGSPQRGRSPRPTVRGALSVLFAVVGAGVAAWLLWPEGEVRRDAASTKETRPKERISSIPAHRLRFDVGKESNPKVQQAFEALNEKASSMEAKCLEIAARYAKLSKKVKPIFKNHSEQLLSWICETEPGTMPMPMPTLGKEAREKIVFDLLEKNDPLPTDGEDTAALKGVLKEAKAEMLRHLKDGGDPNEFLQYYDDQLRRCFEYRLEALRQVAELGEEDRDLARDFLKKLNERFGVEGIKFISEDEAGVASDETAVAGASAPM